MTQDAAVQTIQSQDESLQIQGSHDDLLFQIKATAMTLLFSGIANTLGTIAGHPLDTIRVTPISWHNIILLGPDAV